MNKIKKQREKNKLTQTELAKVLNVSRSTVACWETFKSTPRPPMLKNLSRLFKCRIDDLL